VREADVGSQSADTIRDRALRREERRIYCLIGAVTISTPMAASSRASSSRRLNSRTVSGI